MFFHVDIKGDRLPDHTLCLTFDDGPGTRTLELGQYLYAHKIPATFFSIGRHLEQFAGLGRQLHEWGHLLGNHTTTHPGLVALAKSGGDVVGEVAVTDALIRQQCSEPVIYLRAPYGNWRETIEPENAIDRPRSVVAELLNQTALSKDSVGPINWDISGHDYDYWKNGRPADECAQEYLARIHERRRGIVLMHDSSEDAIIRSRNRTFELTRLIVPVLERLGYSFVRLDEIAQVRSAAQVSRQIGLSTSSDRYLGTCSSRHDMLVADRLGIGFTEQFGIVQVGRSSIALRASNGLFVSLDQQSSRLLAIAESIGHTETFRRIDIEPGFFILQTVESRYLTIDRSDASVLARAVQATQTEIFHDLDLFPPTSVMQPS